MTASDTQKLAEKIAGSLETGSPTIDLAGLYAAVEKINHRLDKLESASTGLQPVIRDLRSPHSSLDKLNIAEAIADSVFGSEFKEKACQFEPDKPCDHCSMCNSRGF